MLVVQHSRTLIRSVLLLFRRAAIVDSNWQRYKTLSTNGELAFGNFCHPRGGSEWIEESIAARGLERVAV